ncbi:hypothetical protein JRG66_00100 [Salinimicrobium tongyeongense]|uniref:Uncharacterized protein n=1 Tax=Salinimicrobium tongyeongense TaxID=2809707 RepID=A0ABY6NR02_9FLAO|nr:hypothetical protein [Salinimicrobium tongyeongense]UZH55345.1 hypothetical protein JRG66_00100 [Salinimicrobium tongyeongense]
MSVLIEIIIAGFLAILISTKEEVKHELPDKAATENISSTSVSRDC